MIKFWLKTKLLFQSNTLFNLKVTRKSTKNATIIIISFIYLTRNFNVDLDSLY